MASPCCPRQLRARGLDTRHRVARGPRDKRPRLPRQPRPPMPSPVPPLGGTAGITFRSRRRGPRRHPLCHGPSRGWRSEIRERRREPRVAFPPRLPASEHKGSGRQRSAARTCNGRVFGSSRLTSSPRAEIISLIEGEATCMLNILQNICTSVFLATKAKYVFLAAEPE